MQRYLLGLCIFVAFLPFVAGCGDGRLGVSGSVTVNGQPMESGTINFRPTGDTKGNSAGAGIVDGKYEVRSEKGLKPGKYKVTIQGYRKTGRKIRDPQIGMVDETLPVNFKEAGKLEVTVDSGNTTHDFQLTGY